MPKRTSNRSFDRTHSLRRYLHIEAVFVFARRVDHVSAPLAGGPIGLPLSSSGPVRCQTSSTVLFRRAPRSDMVIRASRLRAALRGHIDAIICDGGSMDAGPYYLGTGNDYFEREAVKADFSHMVVAGKKIGCPVILGSSGMAGGNRNLDWMVDLAKEVFAELHVRDAKVAVIGAELDPEIVIKEFQKGTLRATGRSPERSEDALRESTIVGQMGIHPLMTALE